MKLGLPVAALCLLFLLGSARNENRATDQVRKTADKIISVLNSPDLQGEQQRSERNRLIRQELETRFDWDTICRSCLGKHWAKLSSAQQQEFMELFKQFLERTYLDRIEPYYNQLDHIKYQGERILENRYASVKTVVVIKGKIEHPVEYRLERAGGGEWRVYDAVIEGVSLVKNYRTQFDEIISRSGFNDLLEHLRTKTAANPQR